MKTALRVVAFTVLSGVLSLSAAPILFDAALTTGQEIPTPTVPDESNPNGYASAVFDPDTMLLSALLSWSGMTTPVAAAHIHRIDPAAAIPGTGPVVVGFFSGMSFPDTDGFVSPDIALTAAETSTILQGLADGTLYFNVHTALNPAGEIRGNIAAIPEPSSVALVIGGALAMLLRRRIRG
jgi:hypothetical protein